MGPAALTLFRNHDPPWREVTCSDLIGAIRGYLAIFKFPREHMVSGDYMVATKCKIPYLSTPTYQGIILCALATNPSGSCNMHPNTF